MRKEVITHRMPKSPISEVFRTLRTNIQFMNTKRGLKSLMVTSTTPTEGKSWVSSNLAVTFAQAGKRVILIDCDLRKGRQFSIFGVSPTPGISNYLSGVDSSGNESNENILEYIKPTEVENLYLIPAGNIPPNPSELLVSELMVEAIEKLKSVCDLVIIDSAPSSLVTDAIIVSRYVDTTIIVSEYKKTKIEDLQRVKRDIENVGGKIAGVVVNKVPMTQKRYESAYYYGNSEGSNLKMSSTAIRAERELKAEFDRKNIKEKTKEIIKQNRNENNHHNNHHKYENKHKYSNENKYAHNATHHTYENNHSYNNNQREQYNNSNNMSNNNDFDSEQILKQLNDYINEEKAKLKGENND